MKAEYIKNFEDVKINQGGRVSWTKKRKEKSLG
jgi:hypothetical protein